MLRWFMPPAAWTIRSSQRDSLDRRCRRLSLLGSESDSMSRPSLAQPHGLTPAPGRQATLTRPRAHQTVNSTARRVPESLQEPVSSRRRSHLKLTWSGVSSRQAHFYHPTPSEKARWTTYILGPGRRRPRCGSYVNPVSDACQGGTNGKAGGKQFGGKRGSGSPRRSRSAASA